MHRLTPTLAVVLLAAAVTPLSADAARGGTRSHYTDHIVGAQLSATTTVYRDHSSRVGRGAGVQRIKLNGLSGTDREVTYYRNATSRSHGHFTLTQPDANGISTITGRGRETKGTGRLRGVRSRYSVKGVLDTKTGIFRVVLKGISTVR